MNSWYAPVAARAGHRCEYCRAPAVIFNFPFEVEHIRPASLGGPTDAANLALACRSCNLRKAARVAGLDAETGTEIALFNPRQDLWGEHFRLEPATPNIVGTTPTGRVTVQALGLNSPAQLEARGQWIRLGLFP